MNSVIADTGFWTALLNAQDDDHAAARRYHDANTVHYVTTWPVLTEACHLLAQRVAPQAATDLVTKGIAGFFEIAAPPADVLERSVVLMQKYRDLPMDLADASLVILAEDLGHGRILSTDRRDFKTYRWKNRKPFENLLVLDA